MSDWNANPSEAKWYAEVVYDNGGGETEYNYGYCSADEYPSPTLLCGPGVVLLSVKVENLITGWSENWSLESSKTPYGE